MILAESTLLIVIDAFDQLSAGCASPDLRWPSGETLCNVLNECVRAFCTATSGDLILQWIAVTADQQRQFDRQTSPPKTTDKRKAYFDDDITAQAEALTPDLLQQIVGESIAAEMDLDFLDRQRVIEAEVREQLVAPPVGVESINSSSVEFRQNQRRGRAVR